jgi:hypothetical protein
MPVPEDDPRHRPPGGATGPGGKKRGTGYVPSRLVTFRGRAINMAAFPPALDGVYFDDPRASVVATADEMERWIPDYKQGRRWKRMDQMLIGLWAARAMPGLTPEQHAEFDGRPTLKELYLLAFTEDARVTAAWERVNTAPGAPGSSPGSTGGTTGEPAGGSTSPGRTGSGEPPAPTGGTSQPPAASSGLAYHPPTEAPRSDEWLLWWTEGPAGLEVPAAGWYVAASPTGPLFQAASATYRPAQVLRWAYLPPPEAS